MEDIILLWIVVALLFVGAGLRILLEKKKGSPMKPFFAVQGFLFPAALLVAVILLQTGKADIVIPVVLLGIAEELILGRIRKKQ